MGPRQNVDRSRSAPQQHISLASLYSAEARFQRPISVT